MGEHNFQRAVFLDRDGVIVVPEFRDGRSFAPRTLSDFRLYPDSSSCLAALRSAGFLVIVVTNQPDVSNGIVLKSVIDEMHRILLEQLPIDFIATCFHSPLENCACRKPKPGMIVDAASRFRIDLSLSYMVGDRVSDVTAGVVAGCQSVFVDLGYTSESRPIDASITVGSLREATDWILDNSQRGAWI